MLAWRLDGKHQTIQQNYETYKEKYEKSKIQFVIDNNFKKKIQQNEDNFKIYIVESLG